LPEKVPIMSLVLCSYHRVNLWSVYLTRRKPICD